MTRYVNLQQDKIFQQYSQINVSFSEISDYDDNQTLIKKLWEKTVAEGLLSLSVSKQYGGLGLNWQTSLVAVDGLCEHHINTDLIYLCIQQISSIYFLEKYSPENIKNEILPKLMKGEISYFHISANINKTLNYNSWVQSKFNLLSHFPNHFKITVSNLEERISFFIKEFHLNLDCLREGKEHGQSFESTFFLRDDGLEALYDLITIQKLFFGILSANFYKRAVKKNVTKFSNKKIKINPH